MLSSTLIHNYSVISILKGILYPLQKGNFLVKLPKYLPYLILNIVQLYGVIAIYIVLSLQLGSFSLLTQDSKIMRKDWFIFSTGYIMLYIFFLSVCIVSGYDKGNAFSHI